MSFRETIARRTEEALSSIWSASAARDFAEDVRKWSTTRFALFVALTISLGAGSVAWRWLKSLGLVLIGRHADVDAHGRMPAYASIPFHVRIVGRFRYYFHRSKCAIGWHRQEYVVARFPPLFDRDRRVCGVCFEELGRYYKT